MADPTVVTGDQAYAALAALGITDHIGDIARTEITPNVVTVTRLRRDDDGQFVLAGDEAATTVTTIGIDWSATSDPDRALIAKCAAHASWANATARGERVQRTQAARDAQLKRFHKLAREKFPDLPDDQLDEVASQLKSEHYARMALKSAQARREETVR